MRAKHIYGLAEEVGEVLLSHGLKLVSAESCTGGWLGEAITAVPGSSQWYDRGFITYSNAAKSEILGVTSATLERYGAVSEETVKEMAMGAIKHSHAQVAIAISGVAGPGGGTLEKPVGTVCFAWLVKDRTAVYETKLFSGDRYAIREQSVRYALQKIVDLFETKYA